jgi:serine/threonine-protein kinase
MRPRFEREAVALAALSHPNIVSLTDYGVFRGRAFLVMELLEGRTLRQVLDEEGALRVPRALEVTRQVLHALAYAHGRGIVHRDLKPANISLQALPVRGEHVKILDFGLVKLLPGGYLGEGEKLSRAGFAFGTPAYMSPEHAFGGEVDGRSDLYSVGILLFELLTGDKPFDGTIEEVLRHHLSTPVPKLWELRPELEGQTALQALVERAMSKTRDARFADAGAFLEAIDALEPAAAVAGEPRAGVTLARPAAADPFEKAYQRVRASLAPSYQRVRTSLAPAMGRASLFLRERAGPWLSGRVGRARGASKNLALALEQKAKLAWQKVEAYRRRNK